MTFNDTPEWLIDLDLELSDNLESINQAYADVTFDYANELVLIDNASFTGIAPIRTLAEAQAAFHEAAVKYNQNKHNMYKELILKYGDKIECTHTNKYDMWLNCMITHKELIEAIVEPLHSNEIVMQIL